MVDDSGRQDSKVATAAATATATGNATKSTSLAAVAAAAQQSTTTNTDEMNGIENNNNENDDDDDDKNNDENEEKNEEAHDDEWTPLMGEDLAMKTIRYCHNKQNNDNDDNDGADAIAVQPQDVVRIDFVGRLAPTKKDAISSKQHQPIFQKATNWVISIGAKDVVPAIEMGVRFMKVGQTALVWSKSKYAHGFGIRQYHGDDDENEINDNEYYELPPNSNVCFEITVHHVYTDEECNDANFAIFEAQSRKTIANDVYAHEWQQQDASFSSSSSLSLGGQGKQRAIYLYQKVAKELLQVVREEEEEEENADYDNSNTNTTRHRREEALTILLDCLNNIVAVHLRAKEYHAAKLAAVQVLEMDPNNIKALIRAAKSSLFDPASSYQEVQAALQAATERLQVLLVNNNNKNTNNKNSSIINDEDAEKQAAELKKHQADLRRLKVDFTKRQQEYKKKSKAMFSKALLGGGSSKEDKASTTTAAAAAAAAATDNFTTSPKDKTKSNVARQEDATNDSAPPRMTATTIMPDSDTVWYKKLPWRSKLLPLLLQMILPFIMWYFVHHHRRPSNDSATLFGTTSTSTSMENDDDSRSSGTNNEF